MVCTVTLNHQVSQPYFLEVERPANRQRSGKQENRRPPGSGEFRGGGDFRGERDERPPRGGRGGRPRLSSREKDRVGWCLWFCDGACNLVGYSVSVWHVVWGAYHTQVN